MKVGDLVEIYRHIPRHESGEIPVGKMGMGVIVGIEDITGPITEKVSYITPEGSIESAWLGDSAGVVVTMKVIGDAS